MTAADSSELRVIVIEACVKWLSREGSTVSHAAQQIVATLGQAVVRIWTAVLELRTLQPWPPHPPLVPHP